MSHKSKHDSERNSKHSGHLPQQEKPRDPNESQDKQRQDENNKHHR